MNNNSFQLMSAWLTMDNGEQQKLDFLGPSAVDRKTHITLLAGANGTSKSRILASIVDYICELNGQRSGRRLPKRYSSSESHTLVCERLESRGKRTRAKQDDKEDAVLPTKILVLSNLVMDRFRFIQNEPDDNEFYQYLGVRQASNLMTTGSMQRSVAEAIMRLYCDEKKRELLQKWVNLVFGSPQEIGLTFDRINLGKMEQYLSDPSPEEALVRRLAASRGPVRYGDNQLQQYARENAPRITTLLRYLVNKGEDRKNIIEVGSRRRRLILRLNASSEIDMVELAGLQSAISAAVRARFFSWPNVVIEEKARQGWIEFGQLSSGEQNILSTGAKLIAHAEPGCLIAIDEPEVSLNTAWQQHYTDLIAESLSQSPGSHVLIATHSPHLISSLTLGESSVVLIERDKERLNIRTVDAEFEGWGAESVLYQVLGIPSASSFEFQRELASVLLHIQENGTSRNRLDTFLAKADRLNLEGANALAEVIGAIRTYRERLE